MKQLLIIRHAESDWDLELEDFNRPLNSKGNADAVSMVQKLADKQLLPELLISSPAVRALSTAACFADVLEINKETISIEPALYNALDFSLLDIITQLDDRKNFTALFGHNPGLSQLLSYLTNSGGYDIPPGGMALIGFPFQSWKMVSGGTGELIFFEYPAKG